MQQEIRKSCLEDWRKHINKIADDMMEADAAEDLGRMAECVRKLGGGGKGLCTTQPQPSLGAEERAELWAEFGENKFRKTERELEREAMHGAYSTTTNYSMMKSFGAFEDREYEVQRISDHDFKFENWFYRVEWKGYSPLYEATWEPRSSLAVTAKKILKQYEEQHNIDGNSDGQARKPRKR
eukprot:SAG11_NODE_1037_length_6079_cov_2.278930_1_plen_182_part_00